MVRRYFSSQDMENIDLNINNYSLQDLLNLFGMQTLFTEDDMRRAKQMVHKTHPDKCALPKEYFLFFTKAYRILHQVYSIRKPAIKEHYTARLREEQPEQYVCIDRQATHAGATHACARRNYKLTGGGLTTATATVTAASDNEYRETLEQQGYIPHREDYDAKETNVQMKKFIDNMMRDKKGMGGASAINAMEFNAWFNETFDKFHVTDDATAAGYGEWLKGEEEEELQVGEASTWAEKVDLINAKKRAIREKYALVASTEYQSYDNGYSSAGGANLISSPGPQEYSSGLFGALKYEDVRKAHTETVIPVTEEDYAARRKFTNINELQTFRDIDRRDYTYSKAEHTRMLQEQQAKQMEEDTHRAYLLARQDEISRDINNKIKNHFLRLE